MRNTYAMNPELTAWTRDETMAYRFADKYAARAAINALDWDARYRIDYPTAEDAAQAQADIIHDLIRSGRI